MSNEPKNKDDGIIEHAYGQLKDAAWKLAEWETGKEATDLYKKSDAAYTQGHYGDGLKLAFEGHKKALGHMADAVKHAATSVKDLITGGEAVDTPAAAPATPQATAPKIPKR